MLSTFFFLSMLTNLGIPSRYWHDTSPGVSCPAPSVTKFYWPHYKTLLISLQTFTNLITNFYWPHYKTLLISLQTFTNLITKLYWLYYKILLTSLQILLTLLQNFTGLITSQNFYWCFYTHFMANFCWAHYRPSQIFELLISLRDLL